MPMILLLDNGSSRAESTLTLRRLASALEERIGEPVHPVSLLHANKVRPELLGGRAADTFEAFLQREAAAGRRDFLVLPLFFGPSRALTGFVPERTAEVGARFGGLELRLADVLYPLPDGEARMLKILTDNVTRTAADKRIDPRRVVLVDHGSPIPEVTAVRRDLARRMREVLERDVQLEEAVMERRPGKEYDFNGELLEQVLRRLAREDRTQDVIISMLFMSAGRHAGAGGDVEQICRGVEREFPGFRVHPTALVGSHPSVIDILDSRYRQAI